MKIFIYSLLIFSVSFAKAEEKAEEASVKSKDEQPQVSQRCLSSGGGFGSRGIARPVRLTRVPSFKQSSFSGGGHSGASYAGNCGNNCGNNCGSNCGSNCGGNFAGNYGSSYGGKVGMPSSKFGYSGVVYNQPIPQQYSGYSGGSSGYNQGIDYHMTGQAGFVPMPVYGQTWIN